MSVSSRRLRRLCIARGVKPHNIFSAPVGADLERFKPGKIRLDVRKKYGIKGHFVIYVGQLHGGQYAELFIRTAAEILHSNKEVQFMVVGDGYRKAELENLAATSDNLLKAYRKAMSDS